MSVNITESARKQISSLSKINKKSVRLSISSGGCQGFSKKWDLSDIDHDDHVFACYDGQLIIDQTSLDIIDGAVIDYKVDLGGSYFTVEIPSAVSTCGCGTSFSL
jgi:iron-sulfur cluster insertion protein